MSPTDRPKASPPSGKITVGPEERERFRARREELGLRQKDLAAKVGATGGTISNLENGKHPQIKRATYARLRRVLFRESDATESASDALLDAMLPELAILDENGLRTIRAVLDGIKKR